MLVVVVSDRWVVAGRPDRAAPLPPVPHRIADWLVRDAMIHFPKTCAATITVGEARAIFSNDHVHVLLLVHDRTLVAVVDRDDLGEVAAESPAVALGRLAGRTVDPSADLTATQLAMTHTGIRRLAVVDTHSTLHGLLCLKRSRTGFCADSDVAARVAERVRAAAATD